MGNNFTKECLVKCNCENETKEKKLEINPLIIPNQNEKLSNCDNNSTYFTSNELAITKNKNIYLSPKKNIQKKNNSSQNSKLSDSSLNEKKDKVILFLSNRLGKSFINLLKEINFSLKIIKKINKINTTNSLSSDFQSDQSDFFSNSLISISASSNNNNINKGKTWKKNDLIYENLSKFKNIFFLPIISLNGQIKNFFEVCKNDFNDNIVFINFSMYLNYFDSFFNYLVNLFSNLNFDNYYNDTLITLINNIKIIEKIGVIFYPSENYCSLSFININNEIYEKFICKKYLLGNNSENKNKNFIKDSLIIYFYSKFSYNNIKYEITYKNFNLNTKEIIDYLLSFISNINLKEEKKYNKIIENLKEAYELYMKNIQLIQLILINFKEDNSKNLEINEIKIKMKTNQELIIKRHSSYSMKNINKLNLNNNNLNNHSFSNSNNLTNNTIIKINSNFTKVKYIIIIVTRKKINVSYEYSFL